MNNQKEIWKPIFSETIDKELGVLDGVFSVSNLGRIKNNLTDNIIKQTIWDDYNLLKDENGSVNKEFLDDLSVCRVELNKRRKLNGIK